VSSGASAFPDRLNPILVKELRSALRGRYFRFLFPLTLLIATAIAVVLLVNLDAHLHAFAGRDFFQAMFGCLLVALIGLVPFSAFLSMGNEWDEHTYDLLVLSRLEARQIVLGKLGSVLVEAFLYLCAFVPFLSFAFLLRGIDLTSIVLLVAGAVVACVSASAIALMLSSVSRLRVVRVILMVALAAVLFGCALGGIVFVDEYARDPVAFDQAEHWIALTITLALIALPGLLSIAAAASLVAHAEENASTTPRVVVTALLLLLLAPCVWMQYENPSSNMPMMLGVVLSVGIALCDLFFVTEPETLTRHVRARVPSSPWRALLAAPFLPGGGRGVLLLLLHFALIHAALGWMVAVYVGVYPGHSNTDVRNTHLAVLVFQIYLFVYLALPSTIVGRRLQRAGVRVATRVLIPIGALLSLFLPALAGFLLRSEAWMEMRHPLSAPWVAFDCAWRHGVDGPTLGALIAGGVALALVLPRLVRALDELRRAARERARPAPAAAGVVDGA